MKKQYKNNPYLYITCIIGFLLCSYLMYYFFFFAMLDYGSGDHSGLSSFALSINYYPFYLLVLTSFIFLIDNYILATKQFKSSKEKAKHNFISFGLILFFSLITIVTTILKIIDKSFSLKDYGGLLLFYPYEGLAIPALYIIFSLYYLVTAINNTKLKNFYYIDVERKNSKFVSFIKAIFFTIFILIASYYTGIVLLSYLTFPRNSDHLIMVILTFVYSIVPFYCIVAYVYNSKLSLKKAKHKVNVQLINSLVILLLTIGIFLAYFYYEKSNPNFLVNELTNIFPLDHMLMKSYPFSIIIISTLLVVSSLVCLINSFYKYHQLKKSK